MTSSATRKFFSAAALATALAAFAAPATLDARPRNGLGEFIGLQKYLLDPYETNGPSVDAYFATVPEYLFANTSTLPFGSMATVPALTSGAEISGILRHLGQPHFLPDNTTAPDREIDTYYGPLTNSRDGLHPALRGEWETYAFGNWNFGEYDNGRNRPDYNYETWGGLAGAQRWLDDERMIGFAGSYNFTRAKIPGGGGHIDGDGFRAHLYAALVPEGQPWWLAFGASGGWLNYKTKRFQTTPAFGEAMNYPQAGAHATPQAYEVGVFAALNARLHLTDDLVFTPFARVNYDSVSVSRFTEHNADAAWRLRVSRFHSDSLQTRLGGGLEYTLRLDSAILAASCSAAWASELAGDDVKVAAAFDDYPSIRYKTKGPQLFGDAVEIAPALSLTFRNGIVLHAAYTLHITFDAQFAQGFSGGLSWRF
ncbi:MAG: autotransporter outer membrane beta-barrel domain-containing protein [Puniceicoccales bacterium]|jgi:outer membrane autotransporter protein|nr:autotransporter outer membrane beta-barrel domain-containing protein [Puniceicoccales bacterium]